MSGTLAYRLIGMNRSEREKYWDKVKYAVTTVIPIYVGISDDEQSVELGYEAALMSKGLLLQSEIYINDILESAEYSNGYKTKFQALQNALVNYTDSIRSNVDVQNIDDLGKFVDNAAFDIYNDVISEISEESPLYREMMSRIRVNVNDVRNSLSPKEMSVEFLWVGKFGGNTYLMAYMLRDDWKYPKLKFLFTENDLNSIAKNSFYSEPTLSMLIWKQLEEYADGVNTIYFSSDGPLHEIAIESLPDYADSSRLISDRWNLVRLSSTRELAVKNDKKNIDYAVLFGGMKYDAVADSLKKNYMPTERAFSRSFDLTSEDIEALNLRSGVKDLPETLVEAENISGILKSRKIHHDKMLELKASETNFKQLSTKKVPLIHVATHGFYWTQKDAGKIKDMSFLESNRVDSVSKEDLAMTRSGLLFSGANKTLTGQLNSDSEDGVLTAKEISYLDLSGVDLLVLSACETGLGDISADGVFGLQRGFKKAGVNTILMSLWKVDDKATQLLMTKFYESLLAGHSKVQSLLEAQKYVREYEIEQPEIAVNDDENLTAAQQRRSRREGNNIPPQDSQEKIFIKPYADPKFWAAFILLDALN